MECLMNINEEIKIISWRFSFQYFTKIVEDVDFVILLL
jgi:hypothetical protein